jgi:hypothetical protein
VKWWLGSAVREPWGHDEWLLLEDCN